MLGVHLVSEAERLAYADRDKYIADTDFVPRPGNSYAAMTDKAYLRTRAGMGSFTASMGTALPGNLVPASAVDPVAFSRAIVVSKKSPVAPSAK